MHKETNKETHTNTYSIIFDYLRVTAMLGVLAVHIPLFFPVTTIMGLVMGMGASCVQIFYVISAYLGCSYFFRSNASIIKYYKRRALRILPTYYAAIIAAIIYTTIFTPGFECDVYGLGWIRYFLGLNTILPSNSFWEWNNSFGFWTMTNFIFFYASIPFIIKIINTFTRSLVFFAICFAISWLVNLAAYYLPSEFCSEPKLLINWSPISQMQYFALGLIVFFAVKEAHKTRTIILLILLAMLPETFCPSTLRFAILAGLFILTVKESNIIIQGTKLKCLQLVSKYSFHIYLTHLLGLTIGKHVAFFVFPLQNGAYYLLLAVCAIISTLILCFFLELTQRFANKIFH